MSLVYYGASVHAAVARTTALAEKLGIHVEYNATPIAGPTYSCPFNTHFDISIRRRAVYVDCPASGLSDSTDVGALLHEVGHVALGRTPVRVNEHVLLGWEFAAVRAIKYPMELWLYSNEDFNVDLPALGLAGGQVSIDYCQRVLGSSVLRTVLDRCYRLAQRVGVVTPDGQPSTYRRTGVKHPRGKKDPLNAKFSVTQVAG